MLLGEWERAGEQDVAHSCGRLDSESGQRCGERQPQPQPRSVRWAKHHAQGQCRALAHSTNCERFVDANIPRIYTSAFSRMWVRQVQMESNRVWWLPGLNWSHGFNVRCPRFAVPIVFTCNPSCWFSFPWPLCAARPGAEASPSMDQ